MLQLSVTRLKWRSHRRSADFLILNTTLLRWGWLRDTVSPFQLHESPVTVYLAQNYSMVWPCNIKNKGLLRLKRRGKGCDFIWDLSQLVRTCN